MRALSSAAVTVQRYGRCSVPAPGHAVVAQMATVTIRGITSVATFYSSPSSGSLVE